MVLCAGVCATQMNLSNKGTGNHDDKYDDGTPVHGMINVRFKDDQTGEEFAIVYN